MEQERVGTEKETRQSKEYYLCKNPSISYDKIPNMRYFLRKVQTGKHKDTTFDAITIDLRTHLININRNDIRRYIFMIITKDSRIDYV